MWCAGGAFAVGSLLWIDDASHSNVDVDSGTSLRTVPIHGILILGPCLAQAKQAKPISVHSTEVKSHSFQYQHSQFNENDGFHGSDRYSSFLVRVSG